MKISFCLITLNEEENLRRCLESCVELADEFLVVDSGSRDATSQIAADFGANFVHQDWLGYVGQKNLALSLAKHDWIFSIDADEEISPRLRDEVLKLKSTLMGGGVAGFSMPRCVYYENRWIRHGDWYPDRLVRLFKRNNARFVGGRVHERLEVSGKIQCLAGDLHHYSFKDPEDHRSRGEKYADLWANDKFDSGRRSRWWSPLAHAAFRWIRGYLLRGGFLDGIQGWRIAAICARETHRKYSRLAELARRRCP